MARRITNDVTFIIGNGFDLRIGLKTHSVVEIYLVLFG